MTLRVRLPRYNDYSVDYNRNRLLLMFPNSIFGSIIIGTDSDEVEIQEPNITPRVLEILSSLVHDQPLPPDFVAESKTLSELPIPEMKEEFTINEPELTTSSRYLGIPLLQSLSHPETVIWIQNYLMSSSTQRSALLSLYNAMLGREDLTPYLERINTAELQKEDASIFRLITILASRRNLTNVIIHFIPYYGESSTLLRNTITKNDVDVVTELLKLPYYQRILTHPSARETISIASAVQNRANDVLRLIVPYLPTRQLESLITYGLLYDNPEAIEIGRRTEISGYFARAIINLIDDLQSEQLGHFNTLPGNILFLPEEIDNLLKYAPNDEVRNIARGLLQSHIYGSWLIQ